MNLPKRPAWLINICIWAAAIAFVKLGAWALGVPAFAFLLALLLAAFPAFITYFWFADLADRFKAERHRMKIGLAGSACVYALVTVSAATYRPDTAFHYERPRAEEDASDCHTEHDGKGVYADCD